MKKLWLAALILSNLFMGLSVEARMEEMTLAKPVTMTAEQLLLQQVDTVCLYLKTPNIAYIPKYRPNEPLSVQITLLDVAMVDGHEDLKTFMLKHIKAFRKELQGRLRLYTPELAAEFDENEDLEFLIQMGAEKKPVAEFKGETWKWLERELPAPKKHAAVESTETESAVPVAIALEPSDCKKRCPALVGKNTKVEKPKEPTK